MAAFDHLPDPLAIYQDHLDVLSDAMLAGDFEAFHVRFHLPHTITDELQTHVLATLDEMANAFHKIHQSWKSQRITQYLRLAVSAEYKSETCICGRHETHLISGSTRVVPPYPNRVRLERLNGVWLETASANAVRRPKDVASFPKVSHTPFLPELPEYDPKRTDL